MLVQLDLRAEAILEALEPVAAPSSASIPLNLSADGEVGSFNVEHSDFGGYTFGKA
jgi:hypothetical protein